MILFIFFILFAIQAITLYLLSLMYKAHTDLKYEVEYAERIPDKIIAELKEYRIEVLRYRV